MTKRIKSLISVFIISVFLFNSVCANSLFAESTPVSVIPRRVTSSQFLGSTGVDINTINTDENIVSGSIPESFSLRSKMPKVKNQGMNNLCWAYAALSSVESSLILRGVISTSVSFSVPHLLSAVYNEKTVDVNRAFMEGSINLNAFSFGANYINSLNSFSKEWSPNIEGPFNYYPVSNYEDSVYSLKGATVLLAPTINNKYSDVNLLRIKKMLIENGALYMTYNSSTMSSAYNPTNSAWYSSAILPVDHAVNIVGYDDNYSKDNFIETPPSNGAFLIRNSWGESFGDGGYFWLSYYDKTIGPEILSFEFESHSEDHTIDYMDDCGYYIMQYPSKATRSFSNVFEMKSGEYRNMKAVSFWTTDAKKATIRIYDNVTSTNPSSSGNLVATKTINNLTAGFHKITLNERVNVYNRYRVEITIPNTAETIGMEALIDINNNHITTDDIDKKYSNVKIKKGESFVGTGNSHPTTDIYNWYNINGGGNFSIKTYSKGLIKGTDVPSLKKVVMSSGKKTKGSVTLKWKKVNNATGYEISYKQNNGVEKRIYVSAGTLKKTFTKLKKPYSFKVRAFAVYYGTKYYGAYSKTKKIKFS